MKQTMKDKYKKPHAIAKSNRCVALAGLALLFGLAVVTHAEIESVGTAPALQEFDEDVAVCRRQMRAYCGVVQQLMKNGDASKVEDALPPLRKARALWAEIQGKYADNPPAEYATDAGFKKRLSGIATAMADMERQLQENRYKKSFLSCAFACGLFVKMHEENGLNYALDRIFHLRKTAKTMIAAAQISGAETARPLLSDLLYWRNQVLQAPCPWPRDAGKSESYGERLSRLNFHIDMFAQAIVTDQDEKVRKLANDFLGIINDAYASAL